MSNGYIFKGLQENSSRSVRIPSQYLRVEVNRSFLYLVKSKSQIIFIGSYKKGKLATSK